MKTGIVTKDGMTVAIKTPRSFKKICKLFFTAKDPSLYIHFYSKTKDYYYGSALFPAGANKVDIRFKDGRKLNKPPKLSYHESGLYAGSFINSLTWPTSARYRLR